MLQGFTCGSNYLALFYVSEFWKLENFNEITWNFADMTELIFVSEKTYFGLATTHVSPFA